MNFNKSKISNLTILLSITFALRISYFIAILFFNGADGFLTFDSGKYLTIAANLVNHNSFSLNDIAPFQPDHTRVPLYSLFLIFLQKIGLATVGIVFVQLLLSLITISIMYKMLVLLFENRRIVFIVTFIYAVDIPSIIWDNSIMSENLFMILFMTSMYFLIKYISRKQLFKDLIIAGIAFGLAILTRPILIYFPLLIIFFFLFFYKNKISQALKPMIIFALSLFLTLAPWLARNYITFDTIQISTIGNINLYLYRAAGVEAEVEGESLNKVQQQFWKETYTHFGIDYYYQPKALKQYLNQKSIDIFLKYPWITIKQTSLCVLFFFIKPIRGQIDRQMGNTKRFYSVVNWNNNEEVNYWNRFMEHTSIFAMLIVLLQLLMTFIVGLTFLFGLYLAYQVPNRVYYYLVIAIVLYFAILSAGPEVDARFRIPVIPFIAIFSALGLNKYIDLIQGND